MNLFVQFNQVGRHGTECASHDLGPDLADEPAAVVACTRVDLVEDRPASLTVGSDDGQ